MDKIAVSKENKQELRRRIHGIAVKIAIKRHGIYKPKDVKTYLDLLKGAIENYKGSQWEKELRRQSFEVAAYYMEPAQTWEDVLDLADMLFKDLKAIK